MRIAIVDDLAAERALLKDRLEQQLHRRNVQADILEYESSEKFLEAARKAPFTAAFLDIYMNGMTGMEAAKELRKTDTDCLLVFTTTSTDHALEGFQVRALHYLVKPFTEEDIAAYYNAHKAEFKLDRPLVKGRIVRFPVNHRQSFKLRELVKASSADRLQDLADICAKNDFELKEFAEWTPWSDFAANLPLRQGMASEQLIRPGEVQQLRDNESHYYFFVTEVAGSGQTAPLETRRATIRRILFNLRQAEVIRSHEEELVDAALAEGEAKIYGNRNN